MSDDTRTNEEFVRDIYDASYRRLVGQLFVVVGDLATAEDVVQEAFVRAVAHAHSFRRTDNPEAWLHRVALNVQRSRWRRLKTFAGLRHKLAEPEPLPDLPADHVALLAALRSIPKSQRESIVLHHLADRPVHEVAATLGVPTGTVKARLSRGRAALATMLGDPEEDGHA
ncbi:MAG: RNA polymerase sigma factor [Nocardioidaceae bacterium]